MRGLLWCTLVILALFVLVFLVGVLVAAIFKHIDVILVVLMWLGLIAVTGKVLGWMLKS